MEPQRLIHRLFLSLWVLFLPFWDFGAGAALVLAFAAAVVPDLQNAGRKFRESASFWPLWGLFGLVLLGTLWHGAALDSLLRMLPLLLLFWAFDRETIVRTLPLGASLLMLYLLGGGLYRVWQGADWSVFVYRGLLEGLHQHVYIGTYLLLGAVAVQVSAFSARITALFWAITLLFLGLLGAKMLLISALLAAIWWLYRSKSLPRWALPAAIFLVLGFVTAQGLSEGRALGHVFKPLDPYWATGSVDTRAVQAKAALQASAEKPWLGWGPSEKQAALEQVYAEWNYRFGLKRHLNVHNQFLEWTLAYGLVGMALLVVVCTAAARNMPKRPWGLLILYFGSLWVTESFMERSLGVALFGLAWAWMASWVPPSEK
ncbi:MAG: O-antigen ligase domain-containing protein [Flavobacteriia bacterium]|nr:O-antigen ligase domain-containing protein [Flavobacteriia bacterium]